MLIHGVGSQWQVWRPLLPALERERDVIALDLPGHGGSPTLPAGVVPNAAALADAVVAFLDGLGVERPVVGGNSLGGWVALELAKRGRARAVVAVSPAGFFNRAEAAWCREHLKMNVRTMRRWPKQAEWLVRTPRRRALSLGGIVGRPAQVPYEQAVELERNAVASPGFEPSLVALTSERFTGGEQVGAPVTIVWGSRDLVLFRRQARQALAALPHARYVPLRGAGHVPTWDDPDALVRELLAA